MKKTVLTVVLAFCFVAQSYADRPDIKVGANVVGSYNPSWGFNTGLDLSGKLSMKDTLDIYLNLEGLTANVWSFGFAARPKVTFRPGTLYAEGAVAGRLVARDHLRDFVIAISAGWQMTHCDFQIGIYSRTSVYMRSPSEEDPLREPANLLYRAQFNVFSDSARWDVLGGVKNFTEYGYERMSAPIFYLGGRYDYSDHLGFKAEIDVKPSGMLHMTAGFFGITGRLGATYNF